jgi:crossover junction endodeoxyribonuclease RusA
VKPIILPWLSSKLSANARGHWRTRERARKEAIYIGYYATKEAGFCFDAPMKWRIIFYPPNKRLYDLDNLKSRVKYVQDGICEALGTNDRNVRETSEAFGPVTKFGKVEIYIAPLEEGEHGKS